MSLYLAFILAYAAANVGLGLWLGRAVRTSGDFFVAGRRLGPGLLFASLMAANIGAGSTVGAAGLGYRDGLSAWWWVGSAGLGSLVLALAVGPRMRRAAADHGLLTVGDYLEHRYSRSVRGIVALVLWIGTLAILAGQLIAAAWVLNVVAGIPKLAGCVVAGAVMTTYFAAGGLAGSARINALQLALELTVLLLLVPFALMGVGGWDAVHARLPASEGYWSFWQGGGSGWTYLAFLAPAFVVSPGLLQKVYGARDDRAVRLGVGTNAVVLLLFAAVPVVLGMVARALHPELANRELAFPTLLRHDLPPLLGALGLAAIFSTEVNTADAILFMLSTSLSRDLYGRFVRPKATDAELLRAARWAAVTGGVLGIALAAAAESVIDVLMVFYTVLSVCLFVPVLAGLYVRRAGTPEALAAIAGGLGAMLLGHVLLAGSSPALLGLAGAVLGAAATLMLRAGRASD